MSWNFTFAGSRDEVRAKIGAEAAKGYGLPHSFALMMLSAVDNIDIYSGGLAQTVTESKGPTVSPTPMLLLQIVARSEGHADSYQAYGSFSVTRTTS